MSTESTRKIELSGDAQTPQEAFLVALSAVDRQCDVGMREMSEAFKDAFNAYYDREEPGDD